jgi:hypothetical protein
MAQVYGSSYLNIAASGAKDGRDGCIFDREQIWKCQVHINIPNSARTFECTPANFTGKYSDRCHCYAVAGPFKNLLLAPRTLHCTSTQLFWECRYLNACEIFPDSFPLQLTLPNHYLEKSSVSKKMWSWIVEQYSSCQLSYSSDKLIAISGLVRHIQLQTREQYYAGLWREDLEHQLCWSVSVSGSGKRMIPYQAPTWSWASINGSIEYCKDWLYTPGFLSIRVLDVTVIPSGMREVSEAKMRLSCVFLFRGSILIDGEELLGAEHQGYRGHVVNFVTPRGDPVQFVVYFDSWCNVEGSTEIVYALPADGYGSHGNIAGLLLEATLEARGQCRRIGRFSTTDFENASQEFGSFEASTKPFELSTKEPECHVGSIECVQICEDDRGTRYIIDLV